MKTWSDAAIKLAKKKGLIPKVSKTTLKAHWIDITDVTSDDGGRDWHIRDLKCSNCGNWIRSYRKPQYCCDCGARMVKK
jgi:hypothetical protein